MVFDGNSNDYDAQDNIINIYNLNSLFNIVGDCTCQVDIEVYANFDDTNPVDYIENLKKI